MFKEMFKEIKKLHIFEMQFGYGIDMMATDDLLSCVFMGHKKTIKILKIVYN